MFFRLTNLLRYASRRSCINIAPTPTQLPSISKIKGLSKFGQAKIEVLVFASLNQLKAAVAWDVQEKHLFKNKLVNDLHIVP